MSDYLASGTSGSHSESPQEITPDFDRSLQAGVELHQWWNQRSSSAALAHRFQLMRSYQAATQSFGFFDQANISGRSVAVMGTVEDRLFDHPKATHPEPFRQQLREFVLKYLMRVSDFRRPVASAESDRAPSAWRSPINWCPDGSGEVQGFGYSQHQNKQARDGEVHTFAPDRQFEIVDLRDIGPIYDWIAARVRIFDFTLTLQPLGEGRPELVIPLEEASVLALSPEFIVDDSQPVTDPQGRTIIGRYGFGYAFVRSGEPELVGYGPGQFEVAFQQFIFRIYENGETRVQLVFVANRPQQITRLPVAPLDWGIALADAATAGLATPLLTPLRQVVNRLPGQLGSIDPLSAGVDLANIVTLGQAAKQWCISRLQLEKAFLVKHFDQHYEMISGALHTWRQIPNWLDTESLPEWVRTGVVS